MPEHRIPPVDPLDHRVLPDSSAGAPLIDYRRTPPGVMPRQLQRWLLLGTAVVMAGIMALSGGPAKPRSPSSASSPAAAAVDANQQRIEEYQRRIQEQSVRLAAEQAQLHAVKDALGVAPDRPVTNPQTPPTPRPGSEPAGSGPAGSGRSTRTDTLQQERAQRDYRSLFADNVAFNRDAHAQARAGAAAEPTEPATVTPTVTPTDVAAAEDAPQAASRPIGTVRPAVPSTRPDPPEARLYRIPEGTIIETVLTNRLDGTYAGPVNCLVTTAVYAPDRQHLLIPAGARVLGEARAVNTFGQSRLAVVFHRLLLPSGAHVDLESFHGLNQIGETGLRDQVDRHYAQIFGASLAVGAIAGFAHGQTSVGPGGYDAAALDAYRQGAAGSLAQSSAHILDRFLNLLPTVTIREGHRIKVYLSNDLELAAYPENN
jgi:type IV secretory pathway VirB10-like protein